jgi:hypothetical protein
MGKPDHDLQFQYWMEFSLISEEKFSEGLVIIEVRDKASAFVRNFNRAAWIGHVPISQFLAGIRYQRAIMAAYQVMDKWPIPPFPPPQNPFLMQHGTKMQQVVEAFVRCEGNPPPFFVNGAVMGTDAYDLGSPNGEFETAMASQLVFIWTAFEALVEDLWVKCLNLRPRLGFIALNVEPDPTDSEEEKDRKMNANIEIPQWFLKQKDLNIHSNMGTVLRRKWRFDNRREAQKAYECIFKKLHPQIKIIFENKSLKWLAALRNAFVHNAGIVDNEFRKLVKDHPSLGLIPNAKPIPLDGKLVRDLGWETVAQARSLLGMVDDWLKQNEV